MLLADSYGARLLVAVGTHYSLVEFLDKGRAGMASTFLTRLRVGSKLVDAKGVSRIYRSQVKGWHLALLVLSGVRRAGHRAGHDRRRRGGGQRARWPACATSRTGSRNSSRDQLPLPHRVADGGVPRARRRHRGRRLAQPVGRRGDPRPGRSRTGTRSPSCGPSSTRRNNLDTYRSTYDQRTGPARAGRRADRRPGSPWSSCRTPRAPSSRRRRRGRRRPAGGWSAR